MSWWKQAGAFFKDVGSAKGKNMSDEKVDKTELEFVSSASEARLLAAPEGASFLIMVCFTSLSFKKSQKTSVARIQKDLHH